MDYDVLSTKSVWIYGSGGFAKETIEQVTKIGLEVLGVIDHRNIGHSLETDVGNFKVHEFRQEIIHTGSSIILAVCNLHGDLHSISTNLLSGNQGINLISPVNLYQLYSNQNMPQSNYWLTTDFDIFQREEYEISNFRSILSDLASQELYDAILKYRKMGFINDLPIPLPLMNQYLADDLHTPPLELRIVDLGACQGENLDAFLKSGRKFMGGFLFEPDKLNMQILESNLSDRDIGSLTTVPYGAWNFTGKLKFDSSGNPAAALSDSGSVEVDVVALDEYLPKDFNANFIKMDIEGAEMQALIGMSELIRKNRPHLAVSAYHKPEDLWAIGNYLNLKYPGVYSYSLRMYGHQTFDTVLYAVPA